MNKHLVSTVAVVVVLAAGMASLSTRTAPVATCTTTAITAQSQCLPGLTPIDHTAAFFPLSTRYHWTLSSGDHRFATISAY